MISVKEIDNKYRLVDEEGEIAINSRTGKPLDGAGHSDPDKANRQAGYINAALEKQSENDNG